MGCLEMASDLAFDTDALVEKVRNMLSSFMEEGVDTDRLLVEVPGTWESIQACGILEKEGIRCCVDYVFCFAQVRACIDAAVSIMNVSVEQVNRWYWLSTNVFSSEPAVSLLQSFSKELQNSRCKTKLMASDLSNVEEV